MDFNVDNVVKAVNLFYNSDSLEQKEVHEWLNNLQNSPHAWSIVWDILNTPRVNIVAKLYFGKLFNYLISRIPMFIFLLLLRFISNCCGTGMKYHKMNMEISKIIC